MAMHLDNGPVYTSMIFLDSYVIPLAKKLKDCGIFGVASA
jgi:hypothetical protein